MKIDFTSINETVIPQFYGGEKQIVSRMFLDDCGKIMRGRLEPGASIGLHKHENNFEVLYILEGTGRILYDDTSESLHVGDCHYCPPGHTHSLINDGPSDLLFFAVVPNLS